VSERGAQLDRLAELEEERRFLLRSLDDLDREYEAGDVEHADYLALRDGYTSRAAAVIREIESGREAAIAPRPPVRWRRIVMVTLGVVGLGVGAGWLVAHYSGQDVPEGGATTADDDRVAQLLAQARQSTPIDAIKVYGSVLEIEPGNVEALTYSGWSARIVAVQQDEGPGRQALLEAGYDKLRQAAEQDPAYPDAQCFLAIMTFRDFGRADEAKSFLDRCIASNPPAIVKGLVESLAADITAALGS
jgi:hypothetical protein